MMIIIQIFTRSNSFGYYYKFSQLLCELSMDEDRLHPDFRMWLLLPFDAVDSHSSVDCFKVAFDCSGPQVGRKVKYRY